MCSILSGLVECITGVVSITGRRSWLKEMRVYAGVTTHKCSVRHVINNSQLTVILSVSISTGFYLCFVQCAWNFDYSLIKPLPQKWGLYAITMSFCLFVCLLPETCTCRALADWPSNAGPMPAVSGQSASARHAYYIWRSGAYHICHSGCTGLLILLSLYFDRTVIFLSRIHANLGVACWLNAVIHNCMC